MNAAMLSHAVDAFQSRTSDIRWRLYGLCAITALSFLIIGGLNSESGPWIRYYVPFMATTLIVAGLVGVEFESYLKRITDERRLQMEERAKSEVSAVERQRTFNRIWQELADSRGAAVVPEPAMQSLAELFQADLAAVWAAEAGGMFGVRGVYSQVVGVSQRLDKVARMSPCFDMVRQSQQQLRLTSGTKEMTPSFTWFCEEHDLHVVILSPVLVRQELVGVLAFFYHKDSPLPLRLAGEMQSAANLFLSAF